MRITDTAVQADFERRVRECLVATVTDDGTKAVDVGELSGNSRQLKSVDVAANDLSEMFDSYSPTAIELLNELKCRLESYPEPDLDELRAKCDAAIEALSAEPAQGEQWQPIETAPKDGTRIDVWMMPQGYRLTDVFWSDIEEAWCQESEYPDEPTPLSIVPYPAFWMPRPAALEAGRAALAQGGGGKSLQAQEPEERDRHYDRDGYCDNPARGY